MLLAGVLHLTNGISLLIVGALLAVSVILSLMS
jgi:hypothetical protein